MADEGGFGPGESSGAPRAQKARLAGFTPKQPRSRPAKRPDLIIQETHLPDIAGLALLDRLGVRPGQGRESIVSIERDATTAYNGSVSKVLELKSSIDELIAKVLEGINLPEGTTPEQILEDTQTFLNERLGPSGLPDRRPITDFPLWDKATSGLSAMGHFLAHYGPVPLGERPFANDVRQRERAFYDGLAVVVSRNKSKGRSPQTIADLFPLRSDVAITAEEARRTLTGLRDRKNARARLRRASPK